jgi:hypothetical protein
MKFHASWTKIRRKGPLALIAVGTVLAAFLVVLVFYSPGPNSASADPSAPPAPPTKPATKDPPTPPPDKEPPTKEPPTKEPPTKEPPTKEPPTKEPPTKEPTETSTKEPKETPIATATEAARVPSGEPTTVPPPAISATQAAPPHVRGEAQVGPAQQGTQTPSSVEPIAPPVTGDAGLADR